MLHVTAKPERPWVRAGQPDEGTMRFMVDLKAGAADGAELAVCFVLDSSGTMRRLELDADDLARLVARGQQRGELRLVETDRERGGAFSGETLAEAQRTGVKPIGLAVQAVERMVEAMPPSALASVVTFAEREAVVHEGAAREARESLSEALGRLVADDTAFDVGDGTCMAGALGRAQDLAADHARAGRIARVIVLTDGIVHDSEETLERMQALREAGISLTTVGIGGEFDEEFLTRAADRGGGDYYYAADPAELAAQLSEELKALTTVAVRRVRVAIQARDGGAVGEIVQAAPRLRLFDEVQESEGWHSVEVGDIGSGAPASVAVSLGLPDLGVGEHVVGTVRATWETGDQKEGETQGDVTLRYAPAEEQAAERSPETEGLFDRLDVYLAEREAQWAKEEGDLALATRRLESATRLLRGLGEHELAREFEAHIVEITDGTPDRAARAKRIKSETRRLSADEP